MVARYLIAKGREKDSLSLLGWLQNQPVSFFPFFFTVQQLERRRLRLPKRTRSFPFWKKKQISFAFYFFSLKEKNQTKNIREFS